MIDVTLILEGEPVDKQLPESWEDVSWKLFVELSKLEQRTPETVLCYLLNLDPDLLPFFPEETLSKWMRHISFLTNFSTIPVYKTPISLSVKSGTWLQLELSSRHLQAHKDNFIAAAAAVIAAYTKKSKTVHYGYHQREYQCVPLDINPFPVGEVIGMVIDLMKGQQSFYEEFSELAESTLTPEQEDAKILHEGKMRGREYDEDIKFDCTLYSLSNGNPLNYNALLELPAMVIYKTFLVAHRQALYNRNYHKIISEKKPTIA